MQKRYAGADDELGPGQTHREVAKVFYAEGRWELGVVHGKADLFPGFTAGDLNWDGDLVRGWFSLVSDDTYMESHPRYLPCLQAVQRVL